MNIQFKLTAALLGWAVASAHSNANTVAPGPAPDVVESVFTSDLDVDTTFGGGDGTMFVDFPFIDNTRHDEGMRSFFHCDLDSSDGCLQESYYIVGRHFTGTTNDVIVAKVDSAGNLVSSFANAGRLLLPTEMATLRDVAFDPATDRLYFVGAQAVFLLPDLQFSVFCLEVESGTACPNFGNPGNPPGYQFVVFDQGRSNADVATRVLFDPAGFLYVAGYSDATDGYKVAVAKLESTRGRLVSDFGSGGQANYVVGSRTTQRDVNVFAMALSDRTEGKQVYIGGDFLTSGTDYDGYVMRLDPTTGAASEPRLMYFESDDGGTSLNDAVTAIAVLANGDIAAAGPSATATPNRPAIMLARVHGDADLTFDDGFCGEGLCVQDFSVGVFGWRDTFPTAIGERPDNRDLVIAMQAGTWTLDIITGINRLSQKQVVQQYSASGITLHAQQEFLFPASDGDAAPQFTNGMTVSQDSVELTGSTVWSSAIDDVDATLSRMVSNDTIFASQFGRSDSD